MAVAWPRTSRKSGAPDSGAPDWKTGTVGGKVFRLRDEFHHFGQMAHAEDADAFDHGGFGGIFERQDQVGDAFGAGAHGHRQSAANGADAAIERQFAEQDVVIEGGHGAHGAQDSHGHGEVEIRRLLCGRWRAPG